MNIDLSDGISAASLATSIAAIIIAKRSSSRTFKLQSATTETEISNSIENAKARLNDMALSLTALTAKEESGALDAVEKSTLDKQRIILGSAEQSLVNAYDHACSKYIDGKVDKGRFKKNYQIEIRRLVQNEELKHRFDPITSPHRPILNVYEEWENPERGS